MKNDTTILPFRQSGSIADALTELAREGAHRMLAEALKVEADGFVARFAAEHLEDGRQRIVRHGFGLQRQIQTGIGAPDVQRPRLRDRIATPDPAERIRLTDHIAEMGAALCQPGWAVTGSVSEGHFNRRFPGSVVSHYRPRCPQPVAECHIPPDGRLSMTPGHGVICLPVTLSASYLHPGGWRLSSGSDGRKRWIYSGDHWRDSGGRERADWLSGRPAGKRTELDRTGMSS